MVNIAILFLTIIVALFNTGLSSAETKGKSSTLEPFHFARSDAEKALAEILRLYTNDSNMFYYVTGRPYYDAKKDTGYARLFTKNLLQSVGKADSDLIKLEPDGKCVEGYLCGLDYDPIFCAQDSSDNGYIYWTTEDDGHKAIIYYLWSWGDKTDEFFPGSDKTYESKKFYRLIKDDDHWKLDGIDCGDGTKFNMD